MLSKTFIIIADFLYKRNHYVPYRNLIKRLYIKHETRFTLNLICKTKYRNRNKIASRGSLLGMGYNPKQDFIDKILGYINHFIFVTHCKEMKGNKFYKICSLSIVILKTRVLVYLYTYWMLSTINVSIWAVTS